jgi:hypothetical protein
LIREWERGGKTLVDLEKASGAKSSGHFSQIKSGKLGASQRVAEYLAKAHNMTVLELRIAAEDWYMKHGKAAAKLEHDDPEVTRAIEAAKRVAETFGREVPEHSIRRAIARWADQVGVQSSEWWFRKFNEEQSTEIVEHEGARVIERKAKRERSEKRRAIRAASKAVREPAAPSPRRVTKRAENS